MMYTFGMMVLFVATFGAGANISGPAAFLALGVLSTLAGLFTAAVRSDVTANSLLATHVLGIGTTLQLSQLTAAVEMREGDDPVNHFRMPIYIADPEVKAITGAFTCQLGGRKVLILEHDKAEATVPEMVQELFG